MHIVFMGTPDFAVSALRALIEAGHSVDAVFTQPDRARGRGKQIQFSPVKEEALSHGIAVYQPVRLKAEPEYVEKLRELSPDVIVVVAFGQILQKEVLAIPRYGCVNIHASLLPKYRGAAPIQRVIIDGEAETGVTTMLMNEGLDTGAVLEMTRIAIAENETGGSLHDKLADLGGQLILSTLKGLEEGTIVPKAQEGETCYASMLRKEEGMLDFNESAERLERQIRGLNPWPSAYTKFSGKTLKIWAAEVTAESEGLAPGTVKLSGKKELCVQTGDGMLRLTEVQLEGKKRMAVSDFLQGNSIKDGDMLGM